MLFVEQKYIFEQAICHLNNFVNPVTTFRILNYGNNQQYITRGIVEYLLVDILMSEFLYWKSMGWQENYPLFIRQKTFFTISFMNKITSF